MNENKITLLKHRINIEENSEAYNQDMNDDRLVNTLINHIRSNYINIRFDSKKKNILKDIIRLIFLTQDNRPFFHVEGTELPLCWNRPKDWNINYIKYEWGHLLSKNQNHNSINNNIIENLALHSARCNQHIQSSLTIQELMVYGGLITTRISNVLTKRRLLFESNEWKSKIDELKS